VFARGRLNLDKAHAKDAKDAKKEKEQGSDFAPVNQLPCFHFASFAPSREDKFGRLLTQHRQRNADQNADDGGEFLAAVHLAEEQQSTAERDECAAAAEAHDE
jgi:hypothetical protein